MEGSLHVLATLPVGPVTYQLRRASAAELEAVVELLAADQLGVTRESTTDLAPYRTAFAAIDADPAHLLLVATTGDEVVATMQLTFIPGLARRGALRAQIEAVRVHERHRSNGLGGEMIRWAIDEARRRGCALVQLTTDKQRSDAHRFYQRLGFTASHEGLKLAL
ncbi:GNAT family N-acetyltransferase [Saccharopolyspora sp. NPDC000359]|uniref:GNAT family N-acetyltransferase n=1 Tax=Saccharopolyspora sp. NPDC000359 TaxID=3154251 RepID=UPI0033227BF4